MRQSAVPTISYGVIRALMGIGRANNMEMQGHWRRLLKVAQVEPGTPQLHAFIEAMISLHEDGYCNMNEIELVDMAMKETGPGWFYWVYNGKRNVI